VGEEIRNCVKPGSGPVFLWLRLLRFLSLRMRFPVLRSGLPAAETALGTGGSFFDIIHNNFFQTFLVANILYVFDPYIKCCWVQIV
jgi:hypothetical protein